MNTTTESQTIETTNMTGSPATPHPNQMVTTTSTPEFTGTQATEPSIASSSTIVPTEEDYGGDTVTTQSTVTDEGASQTTPRSISIEARPDDNSSSLGQYEFGLRYRDLYVVNRKVALPPFRQENWVTLTMSYFRISQTFKVAVWHN